MAATEDTITAPGGIDRTRQAHLAALNSGNADAWADAFTADGVQMPPNAPANAGREAIRPWVRGFLGAFSVEFALSVAEVHTAGEWAIERGAYTITITPRSGGAPIDDSGKYITIYRSQPDGTWLMARDIWNSDRPMPGA